MESRSLLNNKAYNHYLPLCATASRSLCTPPLNRVDVNEFMDCASGKSNSDSFLWAKGSGDSRGSEGVITPGLEELRLIGLSLSSDELAPGGVTGG